MKMAMIGLMTLSCAILAWGETFQMDRKGDTIVEVQKSANEYKVTCKFKPQTKFDKAVNAKFNDAKGDSLCKKGLARYLKVATNESLIVSGLYSAAPVETMGERLCYSFGVPVSGCKVEKVEVKPKKSIKPPKPALCADAKPKLPIEPAKPALCVEAKPKLLSEPAKPALCVEAKPKLLSEPAKPALCADAKPKLLSEPAKPALCVEAKPKQPVEPKKPAVIDSETPKKEAPKEPTNVVVKTSTSSYLCVVKYKEINGERKTISRREYQGRNFKSPKEFDRFCREEFARIRALGEKNLRAVRNFRR